MRRAMIFFMAVILLAMCSSLAQAKEVKKGDVAKVPGWEWVDIMNQQPIAQNFRNGALLLYQGDACGIETGGTITVIGIDNNRALVRYQAPGLPIGTPCPSGVIFFIQKNKFSKMTT